MRKIIETVSTLALWAVWLIGSGLAISDFLFSQELSHKILLHLSLVAWSPVIAVVLFTGMLLAIRYSKEDEDTTKKIIPSEHTVQWADHDLINAQSGKVVDLYFAGAGLACQVVTRSEVATLLHSENQTVHVTVAAPAASAGAAKEASWNLQKIVGFTIVIGIVLIQQAKAF